MGTAALIEMLIEGIIRGVTDYTAHLPKPPPPPPPVRDPAAGEEWVLKENATVRVRVVGCDGRTVTYSFTKTPDTLNHKNVAYFADIYRLN